MVNHEVVPKQLKAVLPVLLIQLLLHRVNCLHNDMLHVLHQILLHINLHLPIVVLFYVLLQIIERQLVSIFKLPIGLAVLLHCVVGQMDELVLAVVNLVVLTGCSQVALFEEVHLHLLSHQHPYSDVELASVDEHGSLDVLLNHEVHGSGVVTHLVGVA